MIIKNAEMLTEELIEMLMQFDRDLNSAYDTDVYLYYDERHKRQDLKHSLMSEVIHGLMTITIPYIRINSIMINGMIISMMNTK